MVLASHSTRDIVPILQLLFKTNTNYIIKQTDARCYTKDICQHGDGHYW